MDSVTISFLVNVIKIPPSRPEIYCLFLDSGKLEFFSYSYCSHAVSRARRQNEGFCYMVFCMAKNGFLFFLDTLTRNADVYKIAKWRYGVFGGRPS